MMYKEKCSEVVFNFIYSINLYMYIIEIEQVLGYKVKIAIHYICMVKVNQLHPV